MILSQCQHDRSYGQCGIHVTLVDGGVGDLDGVVNGVIVDPGGGIFNCMLDKNSKFDPLLSPRVVLSLVYLMRREGGFK